MPLKMRGTGRWETFKGSFKRALSCGNVIDLKHQLRISPPTDFQHLSGSNIMCCVKQAQIETDASNSSFEEEESLQPDGTVELVLDTEQFNTPLFPILDDKTAMVSGLGKPANKRLTVDQRADSGYHDTTTLEKTARPREKYFLRLHAHPRSQLAHASAIPSISNQRQLGLFLIERTSFAWSTLIIYVEAMLVAAVKWRARSGLPHNAAQSFDQLRLPWLCPAVLKCIGQTQSHRQITSGDPLSSLRRRRRRSRASLTAVSRQLGTAAAEAHAHPAFQDYTPFPDASSSHDNSRLPYLPQTDLSSQTPLRSFNPHDLIILDRERPPLSPQFRQAFYAGHCVMTGSVTDIRQSLYACIKVGRFDRAETLLQRLSWLVNPASPELVAAHHEYLTGLLGILLLAPSKETFSTMQKWFELEIQANDVQPSAEILSTMMKASLVTLDGSRLDRTLRRYLGIAERISGEVLDNTISSRLFTSTEWSKILRLCPQWYGAPLEEISAPDSTNSESSISINEDPELPPDSPTQPNTGVRDQISELRPVQQKGLGLKALKKSLTSMDSKDADTPHEDQEPDSPLFARQRHLEEDTIASAMEKWRAEAEAAQAVKDTGKINDSLLGSFVHSWVQDMAALVKEEIKKSDSLDKELIQKSSDLDSFLLGPFLKLVDPEKLSAAAILAFINLMHGMSFAFDPEKVTTMSAAAMLGESLIAEMRAESIKKTVLEKKFSLPSLKRQQNLAKLVKRNKKKPISAIQKSQNTAQDGKVDEPDLQLASGTKIKLGAMFLGFLLNVVKLPVTELSPTGRRVTVKKRMLSHGYGWFPGGKKKGIIKVDDQLLKRFKTEPVWSFIAKKLPMVVEPRNWTSPYDGGYLSTSVSVVRFRDSSKAQHQHVSVASKRGDMKQVYAALDIMGKVKWRINADVFKVLTEVWNSGEAIGGLAPADPPRNIPPEPVSADQKTRRRWKAIVKHIDNEIKGFHSQRCYQNFQLEVARAFLDDEFYCPHNIDFRGRAYPIPPYFNHMGPDYVRGLFLFSEGKELGETGLKWLKIHLANVYGFDKASLEDREAFTMSHLSDIYDSASNPLGGSKWWMTADDPWQCLAACMELSKALESPIPSKYISHLPVHQDGTCNGLQHYAALGGDVLGATQVNLMPGDKPGDIYSAVAELVKEAIAKDAKDGDRSGLILDGKITRTVVKQPVMTNVYGVTFVGAKLQVQRQLVDILPKEALDNDINTSYLAWYTAKHIFRALSKIFNGAQAIQAWLGECGARVSQAITPEQIERIQNRRSNIEPPRKHKKTQIARQVKHLAKEDFQFKSTIVWTTPLGLPIVQPYRERKMQLISTNLQQIRYEDPTLSNGVSKRKQLQAFPPNYIHSLDATHMMLTALQCDQAGLQFSAVHDSFWTHACDVPTMATILRDTFVEMHTEDLVGRLKDEFIARYKGYLQWSSIPKDSPIASKIKAHRKNKNRPNSLFTFRTIRPGPPVDELLLEHERLRLLHSEDEGEREKGKQMITPASILASADESEVVNVQVEEVGVDPKEKEADEEKAADDQIANENSSKVEVRLESDGPTTSTANPKKKSTTKSTNRVFLWTPITFPPIPEKGGFDIRKVRESKYFFS